MTKIRHRLATCVCMLTVGLIALPPPLSGQADSLLRRTQADSLLTQDRDREKALEALLAAHSFGIPNSPAFALLTEKPGKVLHVGASADIQGLASTFIDGGKVATGAALDWRPFGSSGGSLAQYQASAGRRVAWRTVLAVGTSPAGKDSDDVLISAGLRIPILDRGDVRASPVALTRLEGAYQEGLRMGGPVPFRASTEDLPDRFEKASEAADSIRKELARELWNRLKLDVGVAGALRAPDGELDGAEGHSVGVWLGASVPLTSRGQLLAVAKGIWMDADSIGAQSAERTAGARARFFASDWLTLSSEASGVWSDFEGDTDRDGNWLHMALFAEVKLPLGFGWLGVAYGGDVGRDEASSTKMSFQYARYSSRKIPAR